MVDPDKADNAHIARLSDNPFFGAVDLLLVGGSLVTDGSMNTCLKTIKAHTNKPLIIFPGSPNQIDSQADAILLLSLISGRNPDLLIGRHVEAAFKLKESGLEILPTSYILLDGGKTTTVSYISGTVPIPQDKVDIACATALAGEQTGNAITYLDCGSGALFSAQTELISKVYEHTTNPIIVGGGIATGKQAFDIWEAGATVVVVGNKLESQPDFLEELVAAKTKVTQIATQPE